jgi:hypothetical protein
MLIYVVCFPRKSVMLVAQSPVWSAFIPLFGYPRLHACHPHTRHEPSRPATRSSNWFLFLFYVVRHSLACKRACKNDAACRFFQMPTLKFHTCTLGPFPAAPLAPARFNTNLDPASPLGPQATSAAYVAAKSSKRHSRSCTPSQRPSKKGDAMAFGTPHATNPNEEARTVPALSAPHSAPPVRLSSRKRVPVAPPTIPSNNVAERAAEQARRISQREAYKDTMDISTSLKSVKTKPHAAVECGVPVHATALRSTWCSASVSPAIDEAAALKCTACGTSGGTAPDHSGTRRGLGTAKRNRRACAADSPHDTESDTLPTQGSTEKATTPKRARCVDAFPPGPRLGAAYHPQEEAISPPEEPSAWDPGSSPCKPLQFRAMRQSSPGSACVQSPLLRLVPPPIASVATNAASNRGAPTVMPCSPLEDRGGHLDALEAPDPKALSIAEAQKRQTKREEPVPASTGGVSIAPPGGGGPAAGVLGHSAAENLPTGGVHTEAELVEAAAQGGAHVAVTSIDTGPVHAAQLKVHYRAHRFSFADGFIVFFGQEWHADALRATRNYS